MREIVGQCICNCGCRDQPSLSAVREIEKEELSRPKLVLPLQQFVQSPIRPEISPAVNTLFVHQTLEQAPQVARLNGLADDKVFQAAEWRFGKLGLARRRNRC